jgi:hypothetical protein
MSYVLVIVEPTGQRQERGLEASKAVRLHKRVGKRVLTDGPLADAKEMVGGFFLLNSKTCDEDAAAPSAVSGC